MLNISDNIMTIPGQRKYPHAFLGLMLVCASCSQDDVTDGPNDDGYDGYGMIEFRASLPEITTRAAAVTELDSFHVSSFTAGTSSVSPYFMAKPFSKNSVTGKYVSDDPECIWPNNNDKLIFVALAHSWEDMQQVEWTAAGEYKLTGFRIAGDIAGQTDFVTATASGRLIDDEDNGIKLNFRHQLSRIELNAWGASQSFNLEIAGVRFGGVGVGGNLTFNMLADNADASASGVWSSISKGKVDYVFRAGDRTVLLDGSEGSPSSAAEAVSIMGARIGGPDGYDNSAMLIPSENAAWQYKENPANVAGEGKSVGMYFSVLVRVIDTTPYNPGALVYPDTDYADMEVVYLAVDKDSKRDVKARLYKEGDEYFTDPEYNEKYDIEGNNAEVKAFGWAALPVTDNWEPGYVYTYTLNYTYGVGLHDPEDPEPGDPIVSDRVIVSVEVSEWKRTETQDVTVPRK